ncbi:60S ribosomal protein L24, partial [Lobulomyces angularis]
ICNFSGFKIYPGHGRTYVRGDSKTFRFLNGKCESYFLQRLKPSKLDWTVVFRRLHKKGFTEEVAKKRSRRTVKLQRAVAGVTLESIKAKRTQKPAEREAARKMALDKVKQAKKEAQDKKKIEKVKLAASSGKVQPKRTASKQQAKGAAPKVQAKSSSTLTLNIKLILSVHAKNFRNENESLHVHYHYKSLKVVMLGDFNNHNFKKRSLNEMEAYSTDTTLENIELFKQNAFHFSHVKENNNNNSAAKPNHQPTWHGDESEVFPSSFYATDGDYNRLYSVPVPIVNLAQVDGNLNTIPVFNNHLSMDNFSILKNNSGTPLQELTTPLMMNEINSGYKQPQVTLLQHNLLPNNNFANFKNTDSSRDIGLQSLELSTSDLRSPKELSADNDVKNLQLELAKPGIKPPKTIISFPEQVKKKIKNDTFENKLSDEKIKYFSKKLLQITHTQTRGDYTSACVLCGNLLKTGGKQKFSHVKKCQMLPSRPTVQEFLNDKCKAEFLKALFNQNPFVNIKISTHHLIPSSGMSNDNLDIIIHFQNILRWIEIQNNFYFILTITTTEKLPIFNQMTSFVIYYILTPYFPVVNKQTNQPLTRMKNEIPLAQKLIPIFINFFSNDDDDAMSESEVQGKGVSKGKDSSGKKSGFFSNLFSSLKKVLNSSDDTSKESPKSSKNSQRSGSEVENVDISPVNSIVEDSNKSDSLSVASKSSEEEGVLRDKLYSDSIPSASTDSHSDDKVMYGSDAIAPDGPFKKNDATAHSATVGKRKALLIGINYGDQHVCGNDLKKMKKWLQNVYHFKDDKTLLRCLTDEFEISEESKSLLPTKKNIIMGMEWLAEGAKAGDSLFFYFSGHGGVESSGESMRKIKFNLKIDNLHLERSKDETIFPVDYKDVGKIADDEMHEILCKNLPVTYYK